MSVMPGRFTAEINEPFVVFLIGMRINKMLAVRKWLPVANAMPKMLQVLHRYPEKGFMAAESFYRVWPLTFCLLTYWRSFEHLERFARDKDDPHLEAWREFNRNIGPDGTVGIWHETYMVEPGKYEAVYGNMPVFGLAAATTHVPAVGRRETARRRLGGENEPAVESPKNP